MMHDPIRTLTLLKRQMAHASFAQSVTATNITNANTPHYQAKGVESFENELKRSRSSHAPHFSFMRTNSMHLAGHDTSPSATRIFVRKDGEATPNGNTVNLKQEMGNASEYMDAHKQSLGLYGKIMGLFKTMVTSK